MTTTKEKKEQFDYPTKIKELESKLADAERKLDEEKQRKVDADTSGLGESFAKGAKLMQTQSRKGRQWRFRVTGEGSRNGERFSLPAANIPAVDESEAIRLFCFYEEIDGELQARKRILEPSSYRFKADCLDNAVRVKEIRKKYVDRKLPEHMIPVK